MMNIHQSQPPALPPKGKKIRDSFPSYTPDEVKPIHKEKKLHKSEYGEITTTKSKVNPTWTPSKEEQKAQLLFHPTNHKKSFSLNSIKANGSIGKLASAFSEPITKKRDSSFKIMTWNSKKPDEEFFYQNVSNTGTNYIEYKLKSIGNNGMNRNGQDGKLDNVKVANKAKTGTSMEKTEAAPSTTWMSNNNRQIQVRQVKNKTVVKISINDTPNDLMNKQNYFKPLKEDELSVSEYQYPELLFPSKPSVTKVNEYAEPFRADSKSAQLYANVDLSKKKKKSQSCEGQIYENTDVVDNKNEQFYMNVQSGSVSGEVYANIDAENGQTEHHYLNVSEAAPSERAVVDDDLDQVYENEEFSVLKESRVTQSIIEKNSLPVKEDVYENTDFLSKNVLESIKFSGPGIQDNSGYQTPKASLRLSVNEVDSEMFKLSRKNQCNIQNYVAEKTMDDGQYSPCEPFDSGASSDVETGSPPKQTTKVIVTINGHDEKGHKRAASITSSGVGVDSEVSDTEESNISCDSLNSNDLTSYSVAEDHGYHTPTSENKTASPVDGIEYQNIDMKGVSPEPEISFYENRTGYQVSHSDNDSTDIIQQVANVNARLKNLRNENSGVYQAKRIEYEEVYENFNISEHFHNAPTTAPPPPPPEPEEEPSENFQVVEAVGDGMKTLPKGLLRDIRSRNVRLLSAYPKGEKSQSDKSTSEAIVQLFKSQEKPTPSILKKSGNKKHEEKRVIINEKTYEERKTETSRICGLELDTDKFYKFHLCENREEPVKEPCAVEDETFAGFKDYLNREKSAAITSSKGTIRGVKNRVKAGIATFLQLQEAKSYKDKDSGKIVVYSTTMGIVRETYQKCLKVKQILKTLMVKFEERDVFMSPDAQEEIRERMKCNAILVPQVYVEGQHIGDAETIERLNESGELRKILKPYKSADACATCKVCGGYRLLPCQICKGSKKSVHRNNFTMAFDSLKCMKCDQVGLMKCYACCPNT